MSHEHHGEHGYGHGLVDPSIKRSRAGLRAVGASLVVLLATALAQTAVFVATGSVALLADLIHKFRRRAHAVDRLVRPQRIDDLAALAVAGVIGFIGNEVAAAVRLRAGRRLGSPALIADGYHVWPGSARTVWKDCHVMRRITSVMARPMSGSAMRAPTATAIALATTARLTRPSVRGHPHRVETAAG
jgi:Co/Zn/Cd efflux system component